MANLRTTGMGAAILAASAGLALGQPAGGGVAGAMSDKPPGATSQETANQAMAAPTSASPDRSFAMKAARGGLAEVELGKVASQNASDGSVKQFGQRMVDDHSKANDELKQIASSKGIPLPSSPSGKDKKKADRLRKMSGADFDRAYMKDMVADHETDVAEFEREAKSGKDPELKAFAEKTLPTLKEYLRMAEDAASKVGATTGSPKKTVAPSP
jgi:putative membrane protein